MDNMLWNCYLIKRITDTNLFGNKVLGNIYYYKFFISRLYDVKIKKIFLPVLITWRKYLPRSQSHRGSGFGYAHGMWKCGCVVSPTAEVERERNGEGKVGGALGSDLYPHNWTSAETTYWIYTIPMVWLHWSANISFFAMKDGAFSLTMLLLCGIIFNYLPDEYCHDCQLWIGRPPAGQLTSHPPTTIEIRICIGEHVTVNPLTS
jgi:hypothetical protein